MTLRPVISTLAPATHSLGADPSGVNRVTPPFFGLKMGSQITAPAIGHDGNRDFKKYQVSQPRFQAGPMDLLWNGMSQAVHLLTSNQIVELTALDWMGFILPRVGIEVRRGPDAVREAAIREVSGHITNVFLAGWMSLLALPFFGPAMMNRLPGLNPKGIHLSTWIHSEALDTFKDHFLETLQPGQSKADMRKGFINRILANLASTDEAQFNTLLQTLEKESGASGGVLVKALKTQANEQRTEALAKLANLFDHAEKPGQGSVAIDDMVKQLFEQAKAPGNSVEKLLAITRIEKAKGSANLLRMQISQDVASVNRKALLETMNQLAHEAGLTSVEKLPKLVTQHEQSFFGLMGTILKAPFRMLQGVRSGSGLKEAAQVGQKNMVMDRDLILKKLLSFMEQYGDRVLAEVPDHLLKDGKLTDEAIGAIRKNLAHEPEVAMGQLWKKILPSAEDSLISATRKMKYFGTIIPVLATTGIGLVVAFVNKAITKRKHNLEFFPGEYRPEDLLKHQTNVSNANASSNKLADMTPNMVPSAHVNHFIDHAEAILEPDHPLRAHPLFMQFEDQAAVFEGRVSA